MDIHHELGHGEIVYKDALEYELMTRNIQFDREREYRVTYKGTILQHTFCADFVVGEIIVEIKAKTGILEANDLPGTKLFEGVQMQNRTST